MPASGELHSKLEDIVSVAVRQDRDIGDQPERRAAHRRGYRYMYLGLMAEVTRTTRALHVPGTQQYTIPRGTIVARLDFIPPQPLKYQSMLTLAALYVTFVNFLRREEHATTSHQSFLPPEVLYGMTSFPIALLASRFGFHATDAIHVDPYDSLREFFVYAKPADVIQALDVFEQKEDIRKKIAQRMERYFVVDRP